MCTKYSGLDLAVLSDCDKQWLAKAESIDVAVKEILEQPNDNENYTIDDFESMAAVTVLESVEYKAAYLAIKYAYMKWSNLK